LPKKPSSPAAKAPAQKFEEEFTRIVGGHLATLPTAEQDKRLRAAKRTVTRRVASATKKSAAHISRRQLATRTPE
jgi:hypothetical protein